MNYSTAARRFIVPSVPVRTRKFVRLVTPRGLRNHSTRRQDRRSSSEREVHGEAVEEWSQDHRSRPRGVRGRVRLGKRPQDSQEGRLRRPRREEPDQSLADDVAMTRRAVQQQGGPVVLVGHSYGGAVITE